MDKKKRHGIQAVATILQNCNFKGFFTGEIYKGDIKNVCVPGINCYSCPGAVGSCPLGALQNSLSSYSFKLPYYVMGLIILLGVILGRAICGFLCPFGFFQDILYKIPGIKKIRSFKGDFVLRKFRWCVLVVLVIVLPIMFKLTPFFCKYVCPSGTIAGILLAISNSQIASVLGSLFAWKTCILAGVIIASTIIYRPFCKFICPLGLIYGWFNKISLVRMNVDLEKCVQCGKCSKVCDMCVDPTKNANSTECIRCLQCVNACPHKALNIGVEVKR